MKVVVELPAKSDRTLRGYRAALTAAINCCDDGAYVTIDWSTARALREIIDQCLKTGPCEHKTRENGVCDSCGYSLYADEP